MSSAGQRAIELVVGSGLIGYCAYALVVGRIHGKFRIYTRAENPGMFWATVLTAFCIGLVFFSGHVPWRH